MKTQLTTLVLFLFASLMIAQVSSKEKQALLDLYIATNGEEWVNTWDINQPVADWHGVTVSDNKVTEISLLFNNMEGSIPATISNLENLIVLELSFNKLSGTLPSEIGKLSKLELLAMNGNNIEGNIPASIGNLTSLKKLHLSSNNLEGTIPTTLNNLTSLETLNVFDNNLSGTLPIGLSYSKSLKKLVVAENDIIETEAYSSLLLFKDDIQFNNNSGLTPSAKTVIASEVNDDEN